MIDHFLTSLGFYKYSTAKNSILVKVGHPNRKKKRTVLTQQTAKKAISLAYQFIEIPTTRILKHP